MSGRLVTQTILAGQVPGRLGNCLRAAVASLLALPLDEVPHFAESSTSWVEDLHMFAAAQGGRLSWRDGVGEQTAFGLAFGPTVRSDDVMHAVAVIDGEVWDPHPSRDGLTRVTTYVDWTPVEVPDE